MKILDKVNLNTALEVFSSYAALYVPAGDEAFSSFVHYSPGLKIFLAKNTTLGPKYLLFPKAESLYSYATCGKEAEISSPPQESKLTIIFGIRSCDLPACHCFDISVWAKNGCQGSTIRYWDSCMFSEYSQMAGGHNPRPGRKEKVRQRFLHKLSYFPERYGKFLCTGCGRCFVSCPAGLEITQVIRQVREAKIDG